MNNCSMAVNILAFGHRQHLESKFKGIKLHPILFNVPVVATDYMYMYIISISLTMVVSACQLVVMLHAVV